MFSGEEIVRFRTRMTGREIEGAVEGVLQNLGDVEFFDRGEFDIRTSKYSNFASDVKLSGHLRSSKRENEYTVSLFYEVKPTALCWVIAIVGFLCALIGPLIFIMPFMAKGEVQKAVERLAREIRYELKDEESDDDDLRADRRRLR